MQDVKPTLLDLVPGLSLNELRAIRDFAVEGRIPEKKLLAMFLEKGFLNDVGTEKEPKYQKSFDFDGRCLDVMHVKIIEREKMITDGRLKKERLFRNERPEVSAPPRVDKAARPLATDSKNAPVNNYRNISPNTVTSRKLERLSTQQILLLDFINESSERTAIITGSGKGKIAHSLEKKKLINRVGTDNRRFRWRVADRFNYDDRKFLKVIAGDARQIDARISLEVDQLKKK